MRSFELLENKGKCTAAIPAIKGRLKKGKCCPWLPEFRNTAFIPIYQVGGKRCIRQDSRRTDRPPPIYASAEGRCSKRRDVASRAYGKGKIGIKPRLGYRTRLTAQHCMRLAVQQNGKTLLKKEEDSSVSGETPDCRLHRNLH